MRQAIKETGAEAQITEGAINKKWDEIDTKPAITAGLSPFN
jgi:hypothetical protein